MFILFQNCKNINDDDKDSFGEAVEAGRLIDEEYWYWLLGSTSKNAFLAENSERVNPPPLTVSGNLVLFLFLI